jgi:GntR family transcriptional regulator
MVYTYIVRRADQRGQCWPSCKTIASDLKIGRTSIVKAAKALEEAGLIHVEARIDEESGDATSHLYTVLGVSPHVPRWYARRTLTIPKLTRPNEEESDPTLIQPVAKRCRRQLDTLRGQLADAMPVEIAEVRIVNIDGSITLRALATDWEGALIAIGASDRLGSDIHRLRPVSLGDYALRIHTPRHWSARCAGVNDHGSCGPRSARPRPAPGTCLRSSRNPVPLARPSLGSGAGLRRVRPASPPVARSMWRTVQ